MRPIPAGFTQTLSVTVTAEMTVQFGELGAVHPVYATYWMARHFEEAGRKIILPFLEDGEGGIGTDVQVTHAASALPGMTVTVTATFDRMEGRRIVCLLRAVSDLGDEIGSGTTGQMVLPQAKIDANFEKLRARWQERQGQGA
ncbi:thioesterase [Deinococcus metallilatus]|uniref:Thioesterase n=1 Tax=Deinococcus metallilatus TaxID=1211322 RepID=A0AAJ5F1E4_9DEIO|nr:thioesterase family protein [Deinococcus metallilatus]MBB5296445.1 putative thioesterase [Deinococcus metallilatus]QBY09885.1 thioesterase [Deinococcus metallilatus]RXJ08609.1 thioesterase [Deinococcus metallilatus]TLK25083.1 thioesterase [Deinococcus metallilatus]GMA14642.1 thioesterase [Deinococcus metallilatus]